MVEIIQIEYHIDSIKKYGIHNYNKESNNKL